jgi:hypothetical protein
MTASPTKPILERPSIAAYKLIRSASSSSSFFFLLDQKPRRAAKFAGQMLKVPEFELRPLFLFFFPQN